MNKIFLNIPLLQAPGADNPGSIVMMVVMMAAVFGVFYFLIIRPQKKKQKDLKTMLDSLKKGDKVVTIGGIRGTVQDVKEKTVVLKVDENTKLEFSKDAVSGIANKSENSGESKK